MSDQLIEIISYDQSVESDCGLITTGLIATAIGGEVVLGGYGLSFTSTAAEATGWALIEAAFQQRPLDLTLPERMLAALAQQQIQRIADQRNETDILFDSEQVERLAQLTTELTTRALLARA